MRIAYLCTDFGIPIHGNKGASIHVRELSRALHSLGHEVLILSPRAGGPAPAGFPVPVRELPVEGVDETIHGLLRDDPAAGEDVAQEFRSILYTSGLRYRALEELRRYSPDFVYERYSLFGVAGLGLARELGAPLLLEVNAPLSEEQAAHRRLGLGGTARGLEREILRNADRVIAVSAELERWLVRSGVRPDRVAVLPNGVDVDRFAVTDTEREAVRARLGLGGKPVVGFLGTLKAWHGTETLLRAVGLLQRRRYSPAVLVVGDGPQRSALEALARSEGIAELTVFTGAVPHERIPEYVAAMDVGTAPYAQAENFYFSPLKLFEYMAAGRAVVAADVGQVRECVRHGESGWLYPPGDVEALAAALHHLLEEDPDRMRAVGRAGQEYVRLHHTWEKNARRVAGLAEALLVRTPAGVSS